MAHSLEHGRISVPRQCRLTLWVELSKILDRVLENISSATSVQALRNKLPHTTHNVTSKPTREIIFNYHNFHISVQGVPWIIKHTTSALLHLHSSRMRALLRRA